MVADFITSEVNLKSGLIDQGIIIKKIIKIRKKRFMYKKQKVNISLITKLTFWYYYRV